MRKGFAWPHRILALTLAVWMLSVSVGIGLDLHYCKGEIKYWTVFGENTLCCGEKENKKPVKACCKKKFEQQRSCCQKNVAETCKDLTIHSRNCCENKKLEIAFDVDYLVASTVKISFEKHVLLIQCIDDQANLSTVPDFGNHTVLNNSPPFPPKHGRYLMFQQFIC